MESVKLSYLLEHLKRVVAFNYQDPLWVVAEIAQVSLNKGNYYLSLVEKNEDEVQLQAKAEAVLWKSKYDTTQGKIYQQILKEGNKVLVKCLPEFHNVFGLKLSIHEIDPTYTTGLLLLENEKTKEKLKKQGLWALNAQIKLPTVIKRIAVISSAQAAGLQDFIEQIKGNYFGYTFTVGHFEATVQGQTAELEITRAFELIGEASEQFDCVVVVRGGGAKLDLSVFNLFEVCKAICNCNLPVLTGIGHDINETIADEVANASLKTPTALAEFIIAHNMTFESKCQDVFSNIRQLITNKISTLEQVQQKMAVEIVWKIDQILKHKDFELEITEKAIGNYLRQEVLKKEQELLRYNEMLLQYDWQSVLKKGYFILEKSSKRISAVAELQESDLVTIIGTDGQREFTLA